MSTIELQVSRNDGDAQEREDCATFNAVNVSVMIQASSSPLPSQRFNGLFHFDDVTIPINSIIDAADFAARFSGGSPGATLGGEYWLQAEDVGDSASPWSQNDFCTRNWGGTLISSPPGPFSVDDWFLWANTESIFQQRIDHAEWNDGNRIGLTIIGRSDVSGSLTNFVHSHVGDPGSAARSTVDYTAPAEGGKIHDPVGVGATVIARG